MKGLTSARTEVERLPDGRVRFAIEHDTVRGVTPAMLVWWLNHMGGTVEIDGQVMPRYRAWHPVDHVALTYVRPGRDGRNFSAGAQVRIQEFFGGRPEFAIDIVSTIDFLDESGFAHGERILGVTIGRLDYRFTAVEGGTRYEDSLTVGVSGMRLLNRLVLPRLFPEEKGRAWQLHNIEEVGNFEHFLPALYATHNAAS
jgi:hypothetical protein